MNLLTVCKSVVHLWLLYKTNKVEESHYHRVWVTFVTLKHDTIGIGFRLVTVVGVTFDNRIQVII